MIRMMMMDVRFVGDNVGRLVTVGGDGQCGW